MKNTFYLILLGLLFSSEIKAQHGLSLGYSDPYESLGYFFKPGFEMGYTFHSNDSWDPIAIRFDATYFTHAAKFDTIKTSYHGINNNGNTELREGYAYFEGFQGFKFTFALEYKFLEINDFISFVGLGIEGNSMSYYYAERTATRIFAGDVLIESAGYLAYLGLGYYTDEWLFLLNGGYSKVAMGYDQAFFQTKLSAIYIF